MERERLLDELRRHAPADATEAAHTAQMIAFVAAARDPFSRENLADHDGHITGSAAALNSGGTYFLLLWHEKLRRWLQPGGHCEPDVDTHVAATALRELAEETAIPSERWQPVGAIPFDLDVHLIPARGATPAHFHYDVRYLFHVDGQPTGPFRWVPLAEVAALPDDSLARLGRKTQKANTKTK